MSEIELKYFLGYLVNFGTLFKLMKRIEREKKIVKWQMNAQKSSNFDPNEVAALSYSRPYDHHVHIALCILMKSQ